MRAVFYLLLKTPSVYRELQEEIDAAAQTGALSSPVRYAEATKLPLLCACIKEAMRLHPSVGLTMPRVVPKGGIELEGQHIAAGYRIGMNAAVVQRDPTIFGSDADEFRPSRWIEGDSKHMEKYMLNFGAGTRTCIGKNVSDKMRKSVVVVLTEMGACQISLCELHKLVPQVLRGFDLELVDGRGTWHTENLWFNKQTGIHVRVKRRQCANRDPD